VSLLVELFPSVATNELMHCLSLAAGNIDVAVQHLLECVDSADDQCSSPAESSSLVSTCYHKCIQQTLWHRDVWLMLIMMNHFVFHCNLYTSYFAS